MIEVRELFNKFHKTSGHKHTGAEGDAPTLSTDSVSEGTNLWFTEARVLGTDLAGLSAGSGAIVATDTVLGAFNRLTGSPTFTGLNVTGAVDIQSGKIVTCNTYTSAGINACIDALGSDGGTVILPIGTYTINAPIVIDYANTTLQGCGKGTLLQFSAWASWGGGANHGIIISGKNYCTIRDLAIDGLAANSGQAKDLIHADYADYFNVLNCYLSYADNYGIYIEGCSDILIDGNYIDNSDSTAIYYSGYHATYSYRGWRAVICNNHTKLNGFACQMLYAYAGAFVNNVSGQDTNGMYNSQASNGLLISGNTFMNTANVAMYFYNCNPTVNGNLFYNTLGTPYAVSFAGNVTGGSFTGNTFTTTYGPAIIIGTEGAVSNLNISGNTFEGTANTFDNIYIANAGSTNILISGNTFRATTGNAERAINITAGSNIVIENNISYGHDTAGITVATGVTGVIIKDNKITDATPLADSGTGTIYDNHNGTENLLSLVHADTLPGACQQNYVILGNATPKWYAAPMADLKAAAGYYTSGDSPTFGNITVTGDINQSSNAGGVSYIAMTKYSSTHDYDRPEIAFYRSRGNNSTPTVVSNGDFLGAIEVTGRGNTDWGYSAGMYWTVDDTISGNTVKARLGFWNYTGAEVFGIASDGKLWLGPSSTTNLYQSAANTLKTDDKFIAVGNIDIGTSTESQLSLIKTATANNSYVRWYDGATATWRLGTLGDNILSVYDDVNAKYPFRIYQNAATSALSINPTEIVLNAGSVDYDIRMSGDTLQNLFFIDASTDRLGINTNNPTAKVDIDCSDVTNSGIAGVYIHKDYTGIALHVTAQQANSVACQIQRTSSGGAILNLLDNSSNQMLYVGTGTAMVVNESGIDYDFRVEGDTDANLIFVDASTDRVGIGTNAPDSKLMVSGSGVLCILQTSNDTDIARSGVYWRTSQGTYRSFIRSGASYASNNLEFGTGNATLGMLLHANAGLSLGSGYAATLAPDNGLIVEGLVGIGLNNPTVGLDIAKDTVFVGSGTGLPYGSCYGDHIGWSQVDPVQNTWYEISDADMVDGELNLVTHDGNGKLTVTKAGRYLITWQATIEATVANKHIEMAISVSGTENAAGKAHYETKAISSEANLCSSTILSLAANATIEISIRTTDAGNVTLDVQNLNITVVMVGG